MELLSTPTIMAGWEKGGAVRECLKLLTVCIHLPVEVRDSVKNGVAVSVCTPFSRGPGDAEMQPQVLHHVLPLRPLMKKMGGGSQTRHFCAGGQPGGKRRTRLAKVSASSMTGWSAGIDCAYEHTGIYAYIYISQSSVSTVARGEKRGQRSEAKACNKAPHYFWGGE